MYICKNNVLLENVKTTVLYDFEYEFLGRQMNNDFKTNYEKLDSEYFHNIDYQMDGVYFSCDIEVDDDNCFSCISINKYRDTYIGHGRPISKDLTITARDKKAIRECLNNSIVESQEDDYNRLVKSLKGIKKVKKYKVANVSSKGVTLNLDVDIEVPKKEIIKVLNVSHVFIDALYDKNFYKDSNADLISEDLIEPLLAIFSCYDYSSYPNINRLKHDAENRKICRESEKGYKALIHALKKKDDKAIKENLKYSFVVPQSSNENEKPMIVALNNCREYVGPLLKAGCQANPSFWCKDEKGYSRVETAIEIAYRNKDYKSLKLIANCFDPTKMEHAPFRFDDRGSYDAAIRMFNASVGYCVEKSFDKKALEILIPHMDFKGGLSLPKKYELTEEQIEFLSNFDGLRIAWESKYFEKIHSYNKDVCFKMIKQGCPPSNINTFIELDEFDLFKYCAENYTKGQSYFFYRDSFYKLFTKPTKWYEIARKLEKQNFGFTKEYLENLKEENPTKADKIVKKYKIDLA